MRNAASCLTFLAVMTMLCAIPGAALAGGPEGAADAFFGALKKGDMAAAQKVFAGKALQNPPKEGTKEYKMMTLWGEAYQGTEGIKVDGDKATGFAKMDGMKLASMMMAPRKAMMDKITDPAQKAKEAERFNKGLESFAGKLSKMPLTLVKEGGVWKVQEVK